MGGVLCPTRAHGRRARAPRGRWPTGQRLGRGPDRGTDSRWGTRAHRRRRTPRAPLRRRRNRCRAPARGNGGHRPALADGRRPHRRPSPAAATYAVRPGDTLWSIADAQWADGADWTALAALNLGREMGGGTRFVDPDHVRAGWSLVLPADARAPRERHDSGRTSAPPQGQTSHLPELVALGMGSLACAGLARRARRRRQGHRFAGDLGIGRPSEGAVDAAVLLSRFEDVPALSSFEAANRLLGRSLLDRQGRRALDPAVRAICVSPSGVTLWLATPRTDAPDGWVPVMGGNGWHVDHATLAGQEPFSPFYPVVVPVGDDEEGSWLVPLGPGDVLPLLGESAAALWRSARSALGAWAWSDTIMIADDPLDPRFPVRGRGRSARGTTPGVLRRPGVAPPGGGTSQRRRHHRRR